MNLRNQREAGTAYIIALLALVLLSVLALSVSLVSQTEMRVGANERTIQRTFYAAESGLAAATSKSLDNEYAVFEANLVDLDKPAILNLRERVRTSPVTMINEGPCDLCSINRAGQAGSQTFVHQYFALVSRAERLAGASAAVLARSETATVLELLPRETGPDVLLGIEEGLTAEASTDPDIVKVTF